MLYDNAQAIARRLVSVWQLPIDWLSIPSGGVALDVGADLATSPRHCLALRARRARARRGRSEPMLTRAVNAQAGPNVGFLRADAQQLPLRDESVDAAVSLAVLQLIPEPTATMSEMVRVLRPGGRLAVMVPTAGRVGELFRWLPNGGVRFFAEDELGDIFEDLGLVGVRTKTLGNIQWVRGQRP